MKTKIYQNKKIGWQLNGVILISLILGFSLSFNSCQQNPDEESKTDEQLAPEEIVAEPLIEEMDSTNNAIAFAEVEVKPEFPGGESAIREFLMMNTKYPEKALEEGIQGKVLVEFAIDKEGKVTDPKVKNRVNPELDAEAIRVVSEMPDWKPGESKGEKVKVKFTVPLNFNLE